jgi:transcriptional regulator with XRE-family HTH domain
MGSPEVGSLVVGKFIKHRRKEYGMTRLELSEKLGLSKNSLFRIEKGYGSRYFALDLHRKICEVLVINPIKLMVLYGFIQ